MTLSSRLEALLFLAPDPVSSFKIFQGRILNEYAACVGEYGMTEIDATQSIGEQQRLMREFIDETLADYDPPYEREPHDEPPLVEPPVEPSVEPTQEDAA